MFNHMFLFEWRYFTRQPSFFITSLIFFSLAFATSFDQIGMTGWGLINKNSPYLVSQLLLFCGMFSLFLVVNFIADTALRDHTSEMAEILYCTPVNPTSYQLGRFCGSFAVILTVFSAMPLGMLLGSLMPWASEARFGPFNLANYLSPFLWLSVPTLFVFCCFCYALAIRFKSTMPVYLAVVGVIVLNEISESLFNALANQNIAALLDPFGWRAFNQLTQYWTTSERNVQLLPLEGLLLQNRLIWLTVGVVVMAVFGGFSRSLSLRQLKSKKVKKAKDEVTISQNADTVYHQGKDNASWQQFTARTRFEIKQVIFDPGFYILLGCTLLLLLAVVAQPKGMFGTSYWPVTQSMVEQIRNAMNILSIIVITYYTAEVVWRERACGMGDIIDSMPVAGLTFWLSKLVAVWLVLILLLCSAMLITVMFQSGQGYEAFEFDQYFISLFYFTALPWMMKTVLAFLLSVLSPNKYIGMLAFVLFIASDFIMEPLGLGHNMFRFSQSPALVYSDMNGYGVSLLSHSWYMLYWGALSLAMSIIGYGLWQRGPQQGLKVRLFALGYQLGRGGQLTLAASVAVFIISGSNIFYHTRVLNPYYDKAQLNQFHVDYEKRFSPWADAANPTMTKLNAAVDIFPHQRKVNINSQIVISNKTAEPIIRFLVSMPGYNPIFAASPGYQPIDFTLEIEGGKLGPVDGTLNTHWFEFDQPLQPGEQRQGRFATVIQQQGFTDNRPTMQLIENGTFLQNTEIFPRFGYRRSEQLIDPQSRKAAGLPTTPRAHSLDATEHYNESIAETMLGLSSGYIEFETTVSTSADQIAIAPGYLQKEWLEDGRRYFHYKMDAPIENYFAYLSGRYHSLETSHQIANSSNSSNASNNSVDIGIYYHPAHDKNVEHMQQTVKDALDYYSASFGAYQHRQSRVIEIPGPRVFAQDFPNTVAYAERSGFITNLTDPNGIDPLYYMTAHEIAHQWWGGQVDGANVQGGTMLVETLAQYSALMLSKKKYGEGKLRAMLKFELDSYLQGRSREVKQELPLLKEENQPYIHYNKGSLAMMALVDLLGETRLNLALKRFISQYKFSQLNSKHYPTTMDLMVLINHDTNEYEQVAIERLFGQINFYDLKMDKAEVIKTPDNQFEVTLTIQAKRFIADGQGNEQPAPLAAMVDIGLFSTDPDDLSQDLSAGTLYRQKHFLSSGENVITIIVPSKPLFAGVDPFVRFIDRNSGDNLLAL